MGRDLTTATSVIMLGITNLYPTPQQLQGYSAEDVFEAEAVDTAELQQGIDGKLSGGFVYTPRPWTVTLQANSDSNDLFDNWQQAQSAARGLYVAQATVLIPAIGKKWTMSNGFLTKYPPMPPAKKILQPRRFTITFESIDASSA